MHRVLVTASRDWTDVDRIYRALDAIRNRPLTVVHGGARGGDRIADRWARERGEKDGVFPEPHPVPKEAFRFGGRQAPKNRNTFMVDLGADLCLAFWLNHSDGTWDCWTKAQRAGILTIVDEVNTTPQPAAGVLLSLG
jgi:hypothetical protein